MGALRLRILHWSANRPILLSEGRKEYLQIPTTKILGRPRLAINWVVPSEDNEPQLRWSSGQASQFQPQNAMLQLTSQQPSNSPIVWNCSIASEFPFPV